MGFYFRKTAKNFIPCHNCLKLLLAYYVGHNLDHTHNPCGVKLPNDILLAPQADVAELRQKLVEATASGQPLLNGDQDEEIPSEENMEEYVDHLVESLEHEKN